ncbi:MAG: peptide ABC transporter substrate-binding protein, partial [Clostridia bacterium]|nr:peptide ABC transporter substrate-binding protein [Clostridia bacterium]
MKKIIAIILSLILIFSLCGCSGSDSSAIIYYGAINCPKTLDPQTASSFIELMIVRNIYDGLLREDTNGEIKLGLAESYTYDNLTYTFKLKDDAIWSNGDKITANDFVFAMRRAVDPNTESPNVQLLYSIKNAERINKSGASLTSLGVTAVNDYTLKIQLEKADPDFLYVLTTAICMPCNQKFIEASVGKYGMSLDTTISNGSYKLT